jgi:hypothetical protein
LGGGIYRLVSFSGMPDLFLSPFTLKCDKIFDIYPSRIHYLGRLEFGEVNTQAGFSPLKSIEAQSGCTPLKGIADSYEQDVDKFKAMFPVLRDKKIDKDTFY